MKIGLAADHGGFALKNSLIPWLQSLGHQVTDFGPATLDPADDYPDFGRPAATAAARGTVDRSILICNNGIGMCMLANKVSGARAALVYNEQTARHTRQHHDSNILCLGGQEFPPAQLQRFIEIWLSTPFEGGRHARRMQKVTASEKS